MLSKELILHISSINSLSLPRSTPAKFLIMFCDMCQRHKRCVVHGNTSAMALLKLRSLSVNNTFENVFVASLNCLHAHTYDSYVSSLKSAPARITVTPLMPKHQISCEEPRSKSSSLVERLSNLTLPLTRAPLSLKRESSL